MKKEFWIILVIFCMVPFVIVGCASDHLGFKKNNDNKKMKTVAYPLTERQCLMRAMYFESNRTSREGMIAVGTVVMNRVNSTAYPRTICGVVGQYKQFAPGVLTRPMNEPASVARVREAADAVLHGERDKKVKSAMFFHTAGLSFPYKNMHYVHIAGGNAFYERRARDGSRQVPANNRPYDVAYAFAQERSRNTLDFMNLDSESRATRAKEKRNAVLFTDVTQESNVRSIPFVVAELNRIPIPTRSPNWMNKGNKARSVVVYSVPSKDQLNLIVAMLEEQHKIR
ncbi:cell wall hydrolase [Bartonella sp. B41]